MIGGSYAVYKLSQRDMDRIEQETGKSAENLTEEELKSAMRNLGIQRMELTSDDEIHINKVASEEENIKKNFCSYCGAQLDTNAKYCPACGQEV
jgi:hypothetical protein